MIESTSKPSANMRDSARIHCDPSYHTTEAEYALPNEYFFHVSYMRDFFSFRRERVYFDISASVPLNMTASRTNMSESRR